MEGLFLSIFPKEGSWEYPDAGEYSGFVKRLKNV